jgi:hypothetical protein
MFVNQGLVDFSKRIVIETNGRAFFKGVFLKILIVISTEWIYFLQTCTLFK